MKRNRTKRSVIFRLITSFDLGLGILELKLLGFMERYCMASGRIRKRMGSNNPFLSILFWVLGTTTKVVCMGKEEKGKSGKFEVGRIICDGGY